VKINADQVWFASMSNAQIPAPIFLTWRICRDTSLSEFFAKPCGRVRPKAAGVDEVIADLGKIEAAGPEEKIGRIHHSTFPSGGFIACFA